MTAFHVALQRIALPVLVLAGLSACHDANHQKGMPGDARDHAPFSAIGAQETIHFSGTEPFWNGQVSGERMHYATPDNPAGAEIAVKRFAGRGGLSFSGERAGEPVTLAITPGACSDGMSDRRYPFTATLMIDGETRRGCGWTAGRPPLNKAVAAPAPE